MKKKVMGAAEALQEGVGEVVFADARVRERGDEGPGGRRDGDPVNYQELEDQYSTGVYFKRDAVIVRGEGAKLWDDAGREYVDCVGGHGSVNIGHCNPAVVKAIEEQARRLISCTEVFYNDVRAQFLAKVASITPPRARPRLLLQLRHRGGRGGAEVRAHGHRPHRRSSPTMRAFHGRTMGALSATWEPKYREPFMPLVPGFKHVPYDNAGGRGEAMTDDTAAVILSRSSRARAACGPGSAAFFAGGAGSLPGARRPC